jgi:hypothetical protein
MRNNALQSVTNRENEGSCVMKHQHESKMWEKETRVISYDNAWQGVTTGDKAWLHVTVPDNMKGATKNDLALR